MTRTGQIGAVTKVALAIVVSVAASADALIVGDGKGKAEADCAIGLEGYQTTDFQPFRGNKKAIQCADGDPCDADGTVNQSCTFRVAARTGLPDVPNCTPAAAKKIKAKGLGKTKPKVKSDLNVVDGGGTLPLDGSSAMGSFVDIVVPIKKDGKKPAGKVTLLAKRKPKDKDVFNLLCKPWSATTSSTAAPSTTSTTTTTLPTIGGCLDNPAGGPDEWILSVGDSGSDLDNGWTGVAHNFPVTPNGVIQMCLAGCDGTTDTVCDGLGEVGAGTFNGPVFGAPIPLLASSIPVCVVNNFNLARTVTGTLDLATGDATLEVGLLADIYFTDSSEVCPRCNDLGRCSGGTNQGGACSVDATLEVVQATGNTTYDLSKDCPPAGNPSTLVIDLPLTTATTDPPLVGEIPCGTQGGIAPKPNDCSASCNAVCTGNACVSMVEDPVNPAQMVCKDAKGGIAQRCCSDNTQLPCFPLEAGGMVTRTGRPGVPLPALPDTTYPKTGNSTLAAVFCEAATATTTINIVAGLPGPAAILLTGPFSIYENTALRNRAFLD